MVSDTAERLCFFLGFGENNPEASYTKGQSLYADNFAIDNLVCSSSVTSPDGCSYATYDNCGTGEGLFLDCGQFLSDAPDTTSIGMGDPSSYVLTPETGRVSGLALVGTQSEFQYVCADSVTATTAQTLCQLMGYEG